MTVDEYHTKYKGREFTLDPETFGENRAGERYQLSYVHFHASKKREALPLVRIKSINRERLGLYQDNFLEIVTQRIESGMWVLEDRIKLLPSYE